MRPRENGDAGGEGGMSEMDRRQRELYAKQQQLLREQRSQDQEKLLACISGGPRSPAFRRATAHLDTYRPALRHRLQSEVGPGISASSELPRSSVAAG